MRQRLARFRHLRFDFDHPAGMLGSSAGFTLLEVILAIAVLALSMAAIGEVMRNAYRNATAAAAEVEAQVAAQSVLAELASGLRELANTSDEPLDASLGTVPLQVSVAVEPTTRESLLLARVIVMREGATAEDRPLAEVSRWILDPTYASELAEAAAATESGTTGTSTSSTGL